MKRVLFLLITFILIPWDTWSQTPRDLCQPPTDITVVGITTNSATISWTRGGTETAWELTVGNSIFYLTDTFYTVHYLDSNTTYNITVRSICDVGDTSIAASGIFHTPCYFLRSLPYYNDFESEPHYSIGGTSRWDAFPECWTRINDGTSNAYYPHITNESENVINGNKSMCFQHYGYANNEYAVLPPVETNLLGPIANLHISFYAKGSVVSAPFPMFIVGVMDSPDDTSTFVPVDTVYLTLNATLYSVSFANYSGTGQYVAFRSPRIPSQFGAYLDDVYLTNQWCEPPATLTAIASHNEISLSWERNGGSTFSIILNNNTVARITDTFYTISGLTENTVYEYAVAAECDGETSPWLRGSIRTECRPLTYGDLPYSEDFEAYSYGYHVWDISPCWRKGDSRPTVNYPYPVNCVVDNDTVGLSMGSSPTSYEWAVLPRVDNLVQVDSLELDFLIIRSNQTNTISRLIVGVVSDLLAFEQSGLQTFVPVDTIDVSNEAINSIHPVAIRFANYTGSGKYITFLAPQLPDSLPSSVYNSFIIDNVVLKVANPCPSPQHVSITHTTHNSVSATWDGVDQADSCLVLIGTPGADISTFTPHYVHGNSGTFYSLSPNTDYALMVQAYCESGLSDPSYPVRFHTLCTPLNSLPFMEDFESVIGFDSYYSRVNNLPSCWLYYNIGYPLNVSGGPIVYTDNPYTVYTDQSYVYSGLNSMLFSGMNQYAIMPLTDPYSNPLSYLQVSFWTKSLRVNNSGRTAYVTVGVMSDPTDTSTFVPIRNVTISGSMLFERFTIGFANYEGPHGHVALKSESSSMFVIDDIILEEIPNRCPPISAIHTIVTASAARLTWDFNTEFGTPTSFEVSYRNVEDTLLTTVVTYEPEFLLRGLAPDSSYWVSVATECGGLNGGADTIVIRTQELPCIRWDTTARAVDTLVLGIPGTATTAMYPVNASAPFSKVQHLFLASEIPTTGPTTITGIGFDYADNQPYQVGSCEIHLSHSPNTNLSGVTNPNLIGGGQLVFSGTLSFPTEGWNYIPFNQGAFEYDGTSNLSVTITKNSGVSVPVPRSFRQEIIPDLIMTRWAARANRYASYVMGNTDLDKRSNTRLITGGQDVYCTERATCIPPITLVDTSVTGIVRLLWIPGYNEASWDVDYRLVNPADTGEWVNVASETTATQHLFSIADLDPGSIYEYRVTANCSDTLLSSSATVTTPCIPLSIPFHYGFEGLPTGSNTVPANIHCWHHLNDAGMYNGHPIISAGHHTGNRGLGFGVSASTYFSNYQAIVLPPVDTNIDAINALYLNFWARSSTRNDDPILLVGVMTNPNNINTFQTVDSVFIDPAVRVWDRYEVSFENYNGNGRYIAIRANRPSLADWTATIDDITISYEPMCRRVDNIRFRDVTTDSATVYWTRGGNETRWELSIGDSIYYLTDTVFNIHGLEADTVYTVSIRAICSAGDTSSYWSSSFHTPCYLLSNLPLINDFENTPHYERPTTSYVEAFPNCWRRVNDIPANNNTNGRPYNRNNGTSGIHGNNSIYWELTTEYKNLYVVLPPVDKDAYNIRDLYLMFYARTLNNSALIGSYVIGVMDHEGDTANFVPVDSITPARDVTLYTVSFANYSGTGNYITIRGSVPSYGRELLLDDLVLTDFICNPISHLRASCTDTSVTLVWSPEGNNRFTAVLGNDTVRGITDTFYTFHPLANNTLYNYAVAAECERSSSGTSDSIAVNNLILSSVFQTGSIQTECPPLTYSDLPFREDFESYAYGYEASINPCWHRGSVPSTVSGRPHATHTYIGEDTVGFNMASSSHYYRWAALPRLDTSIDITSLEVNFLIERPGSGYSPIPSSRLIVGVAEDVTWFSGYLPAASMELSVPSLAYTYSGLVPVDTVDLSDEPVASLHSVTVRFVNYRGSGRYIVFYTPSPGSDTLPSNGFYIDNIELRLSRPCPTPEHVRVTRTTADSVFVTWDCGLHPCGTNGTASPDRWLVYVGVPGFDIGSVSPYIFSGNSAFIGGLNPNSDYELVVVASCGSNSGYSSYPVQFHTQCAPLNSLPFVEDFESVAGLPSYTTYSNTNTLPDCWLRHNTSVGGEYSGAPLVHNDSTYAHSGHNAMRFHTANYPIMCSDQYAIMPLTDSVLFPARGLQVSFWLRTAHFYYNSFIVVGVMSDPCDTNSFVAMDTVHIESLGNYSHHTVRMSGYRGPHGHIAFKAPFQSPVNRPYIDDIVLDEMPCGPAEELHVAYTGLDSLCITWTDTSSANIIWYVEYDTVDFAPGTGVVDPVPVTDTFYMMTGLDSGTVYHIYVYPNCFDSVVARHLVATTLLSTPSVLPFISGFEGIDATGWTDINGGQANRWMVGDATGNPGYSLYISDDGVINHYSGYASTVFAARPFRVTAPGEYAYHFDWKCNGEDVNDYLRAAFVPAQTILVPGDYSGFDNAGGVPQGGIALDGGNCLSQNTIWQTQSGTFSITEPGNYVWVFMWHNDGSTFNQTPAAIDNIVLEPNRCPMPQDVEGIIAADSLSLTWTAYGSESAWEVRLDTMSVIVTTPAYTFTGIPFSFVYTVHIRSICGIGDTSLAYTASFDNIRYMVSVLANNPAYGTVSGSGMYYNGDRATLAASPYIGFKFVDWDDGDTNNPRRLIVTSDTTLTANFDREEGIDAVDMDNCVIYPNPTTGKVTIAVDVPLSDAVLTDMAGRREELKLVAAAPGVYTLDLSSHTHATYLLTLTTIDGRQRTIRLIKVKSGIED
ncbi:MAG: hypothetical protein J6T03_05775 [Bacteroidales bacterium]|nr:hypothetical protein [Bacteroidales bacterium]